jgi:hypothetical protein
MIAPLASLIASPPASVLPYLDPGTGSYLLQILIAAGLSAASVLYLLRKRIAAFFSRLLGRRPAEPGKDAGPSDDE